jgi:putative flippase GtrA
MTNSSQPVPSSQSIKQFKRFILVGCSNFAVSFVVFYVFYNHLKLSGIFFNILGPAGEYLESFIKNLGAESLNATLANFAGYSAGILNSFIWNKFWTFEAERQAKTQFFRFLVLNLACLVLSSASLFFFTDYLNWPYLPVWIITMGIVTLVNFAVSKFWVFVNQ